MNVHPSMEFHVSAASRDAHGFEESLFSSSGRVIFTNFAAARRFAVKLNERNPNRGARAGDVNAMGLIDEVLHALIAEYRTGQKPNLWREALATLEGSLGAARVGAALEAFGRDFPPLAVYAKRITLEAYLRGSTDGLSNREVLLEEMLLLWLENQNEAFRPYQDLFDDSGLRQTTAYASLIAGLETYLEAQDPFEAAGGLTLWRVLRLPALAHPSSLEGQLRMLLERFGGAFNAARFAERFSDVRGRLLGGLDLIAEENKFLEAINERRDLRVGAGFVGGFAGDSRVQRVNREMLEYEPEAFTQDQSWMPRLVLMAKNAFVWLDQLRKIYGDQVRTLRDVPDAELERLASWGITGLWLIGLWERSAASKEIKHRMGNPDAVASAYSLYDYAIADALGGDGAIEDLKARAWKYGIRMASDMVPNHVGIDGKWVVEHPEYFLQTAEPPFPGYSFHSADLSSDSRIAVHLEDHYYAKTDASVVFKRVDRRTGATAYLYHGNDGSGLPWNDTAQLNYLSLTVRETVIETILKVAKQFPVIRFDAAMTLAKKHIKRLWFPEPGSGEGIASRSEYGMTREQFDALMPQEFWREVVDRAAVEAPDTLLLAEAFWMMEGYFVRSLGMHRVYNSAFMNMMRDEKNDEYRTIIKETAANEPEILKRYVNFLNNPDEETAVDQFGKSDKYFGVMTLCATLPGLPMIGHGQIEGYTEKYGMEYRRAYYDERPDEGLIQHHGSQIFPLLKKRALFAETEHFVLYDFTHGAAVNENVFAYSNANGSERALILYNNANHLAAGTVQSGQGAKKSSTLAEGLQITEGDNQYAIYRDRVSNLEFIRSSGDLRGGLRFELGAYSRAVLMDWREVYDSDGRYARLNRMLEGRGVESVEAATMELYLERVLTPWNALVNAANAMRLAQPESRLYGELEARAKALADGVEAQTGRNLEGAAFSSRVRARLEALKPSNPTATLEAFAVVVTTELGTLAGTEARGLMDDLLLARLLERSFKDAGLSAWDASLAVARVKFLVSEVGMLDTPSLAAWTNDLDAPAAIGLNRFEGATYLSAEPLEATIGTAKLLVKSAKNLEELVERIAGNGYRVDTPMAASSAAKPPRKAAAPKAPASPAAANKPVPRTAASKGLPSSSSDSNARRTREVGTPEPVSGKPAATKAVPKTPAKKTASSRTNSVPTVPVEPATVAPTAKPARALKPKAPSATPTPTVGAKRASPATAAELPVARTKPKATKAAAASSAQKPSSTSVKPTAKPKPAPITRDDLTAISGIGPKVAVALEAIGIVNFAQLSQTKPDALRAQLEGQGIRLFTKLDTWAAQAKGLKK